MNPSTPTETVVWLLVLLALALLFIGLTKKPMTPRRNEQLMRRHRCIRERQLGEAHRDDGFTLPFPLFVITGILGAHAMLAVGYAITCAVFGCQEPHW